MPTCVGRTKKGERCRQPCRVLFCHRHRSQRRVLCWSGFVVLAVVAGAYNDIPKFFGDAVNFVQSWLDLDGITIVWNETECSCELGTEQRTGYEREWLLSPGDKLSSVSKASQVVALTLDGLSTLSPEYLSEIGKKFPKVRWLKVSRCSLSDRGLEAIAREFQQIELLTIDGGSVTSHGVKHLKQLRQLASLDLWYLDIKPPFASLGKLSQLAKISIRTGGKREFEGNDLAKLSSDITHLNLVNCGLGDEDLRALEHFSQLRHLNLKNNPVTSSGMVHVSKIASLRSLVLTETDVDENGLANLASLNLQCLNVKNTFCAPEDVARHDFAGAAVYAN